MSTSEFNPLWVEAAKAGDQSAISTLYEYSYRNVYLTIKSMLKGDEDTLLDLLQDSFLKAFRSLDQLSDPNSFNAWVKTIARNQARDWLKKAKPVLFSTLASEDDNAPELTFEDDDVYNLPDVVADRKETARLINEILDTLSDSQRMAIGLFYYQDMSINQVAEEMGVKPGTVKALLSQGRQRVKAKVEALEKQGTKLYSLSPMAFLLWLFRNWGEGDQPNRSILGLLLQQCAKTAAQGAAQGTGTLLGAKAAAAVSAAGHAAGLKIASLVAAVALLGGIAVGGGYLFRDTDPAEPFANAVTGVEEDATQAPDEAERPETGLGEDAAPEGDGENGGTPTPPTDRDTDAGNRDRGTGEAAQLVDTTGQGAVATPLVNPVENTAGTSDEIGTDVPDTADGAAGTEETPSAPVEGTGETEDPSAPTEGTGETEEPSAPVEDTGETEEPSAPVEDTGETAEPSTSTEEPAEDEETGVTWSLSDDGVLTISGSGPMDSYTSAEAVPWYSRAAQIRSVVVEDGVTAIGDYALKNCANLTSVTLPDGLTSIGEEAFRNCTNLREMNLPDTLTEIKYFALGNTGLTNISIPEGVTSLSTSLFSGCDELVSISLPSTLTMIEMYAFYGCSNLPEVEIPNAVTIIRAYAFWGCTSLTNISIPQGATTIDAGAFSGSGLTSISIPSSVTVIVGQMFENCSALTNIVISDAVTAIESRAFAGCSGLTDIELPESLENIGIAAFSDCTSLTSLTIPNGVTEIADQAFSNCSALTEVHFTGDLPALGTDVFLGSAPTIYYPADNATWTEEALNTYFSGFTVIAE